ncbi:MAG: CpsB/CapC family capsule biosynthesis tyrosine phosphatase [Candidatus Limivivens sp.]|nr:CpsB/CapC family capsule biosynthesis tyrosine phosphatase [Candidatus Limivivens sp.]
MRQNRRKICVIAALILAWLDVCSALAGSINGNEAGVLAAAGGKFEYEGRTYQASEDFKAELESELARDDVDLTAEEAAEYTARLYEGIPEKITKGILKAVEGEEPEAVIREDEKKKEETGKNENEKEIPPWILAVLFGFFCGAVLWLIIRQICRDRRIQAVSQAGITPLFDIHCHIMPGVDDGAPDLETALEMLGVEFEQGIRHVILTPHYRPGYRHCSAEQLFEVLDRLKKAAGERYPELELSLGNELSMKEGISERLEGKKALTLGGSRYVLAEFEPEESFPRIYDGCMRLMRAGYVPVIAHVERYPAILKEEHIREFRHCGILLQMNYESIPRFRKYIKAGYVDLLSTDAHGMDRRTPHFERELRILYESCTQDQIQRILKDTPEKIWSQRKY